MFGHTNPNSNTGDDPRKRRKQETVVNSGVYRKDKSLDLTQIPHISDLMTQYLGSDPTNESNKENISWMASFTKLFKTKTNEPSLIHTAQGGYNKVSIYETATGKYAVRQNINNFLSLDNIRRLSTSIAPIIRSIDIIEQASKHELSPHVYYIGLANFSTKDGPPIIGVAQISEAYDMDLSTYYNVRQKMYFDSTLQVWGEDETDGIISEQIIDLISRMVKTLHLSCFDIKPGNCVIKNVSGKPIVKLIDWDEDFCIYTPAAKKVEGEMSDKIILLQIILMANHFYNTFSHNILHDYVRTHVNHANISALSALFCGETNSTESYLLYKDFTMYQRQSMYYFFNNMYPDSNIPDSNIPAVWDSYLQPTIAQVIEAKKSLRHGVFIDLIKNAMRLTDSDESANDIFIGLNFINRPVHYAGMGGHRKTAKKITTKKTSAKKTSAKKTSAKKITTKKTSAKKTSAKKTSAKKITTKKITTKKRLQRI